MFKRWMDWREVYLRQSAHVVTQYSAKEGASPRWRRAPALRSRDFAYLECLASTELSRIEAAPIYALLDKCRIIAPHEPSVEFIGLGSHVLFDIDSAPVTSRMIVAHRAAREPEDLSIVDPLACALLGRCGGDVVIARTETADPATVMIHSVRNPQ